MKLKSILSRMEAVQAYVTASSPERPPFVDEASIIMDGDLAMAYIRDTELAFGEIAYLLGFASAEAFQRAFKRWNQKTPGEYRREQRRAL